jgi:hypothetical protein
VRQLVREQVAAALVVERGHAVAEEDVVAGGQRLRRHRVAEPACDRPGVHPHTAEVGPERRLHAAAHVSRQGAAAAAGRRQDSRGAVVEDARPPRRSGLALHRGSARRPAG